MDLGALAGVTVSVGQTSGGPERLLVLPPPEHLGNRLVDRLFRVVQKEGVLRGLEWRDTALRIARIARLQVGAKNLDSSVKTL